MMTTRRIDELLHLFNEKAPISRTFGMTLSFDDEARAIVAEEIETVPSVEHLRVLLVWLDGAMPAPRQEDRESPF